VTTNRRPRTPGEWQDAADLAEAALLVDSARTYGIITGGPAVDAARAASLLEQARRRGVLPRKPSVTAIIRAMAGRPATRPARRRP
jgi:hypothetical protein